MSTTTMPNTNPQPRPTFPGSPDYFRQSAANLTAQHTTHLNPLVRAALIAVAIAGTVVYGIHVQDQFAQAQLDWIGPGVAWGAGLAWVVLAAGAAVCVKDPKHLGQLADHALCTLTLGMVGVLSAMALTKATSLPPVPTHLTVLALANLAMAVYFIARAPAANLPPKLAAALWIGLMNGVLAIGLLASYLLGGNNP